MIAGTDGLAHESKVEDRRSRGDNVQILSGVKPGDQVITEGALGLDDKAKIEIQKPGETAEPAARIQTRPVRSEHYYSSRAR